MRIWTVPGVFRPISDSLMLADAVRGWASPGKRTLDVFTGSGVIEGVNVAEGDQVPEGMLLLSLEPEEAA